MRYHANFADKGHHSVGIVRSWTKATEFSLGFTLLGPSHGDNLNLWIPNIFRDVQSPNQKYFEIHGL
jgi:hypothetical protein